MLSGFFDIVNKLEDIVLAILVAGMVLVIMIQIIGRIIGRPFPWTEESSRYLFLWMMFVALAAGFNKCESSRVTLFLQMGPKWLKKCLFCRDVSLRLGSSPAANRMGRDGHGVINSHVDYRNMSAYRRGAWNNRHVPEFLGVSRQSCHWRQRG